jgi:hypothetical protein
MADDNTVRHAAAAILAGAGVALDGARISVGYGTITVNPLVDALPTVGLETSVSVDAAGTVQWANGWLGATVKGETYPVITAAQAFEKLQAQPRMYAMRCLAPEPAAMPGAEAGTNPAPDAPIAPSTSPSASPGTPVADPPSDIEMPCGGFTPPPMAVTGATFGLSVQWLSDNSSVLAPAWLFTTKDSESWPTPILAIDPSFIGAPADLPTDVSTGKGIVPDAPGSTSAVPTTPAPKPAVSTP